MKTRRLNKALRTALAVLGLSVVMVGYNSRSAAAAPAPPATTNAAPTRTVAPAQVSLPQVPAEVLRMSEAGISDDVITAYIRNSANGFALDADQIVYLRDVGISSAVLNALVSHSQTTRGNPAEEVANGAGSAQDVSSSPGPASAATATPVNGPAGNFYDALTPYGTWVDVPAYGWCWQPTVEAVNPSWQPYCDDGSWLWTDNGWYWNSYYAWGWAPFHYGRWCRYPSYGWLWCPDNVWGPAWVCWRDYPGYCGWAPLPPGACFAGLGWTFNGVAVGFDFGFGLGPNCFTFCDYDNFCGQRPFGHFRHGRDADRFFHDSRVNNNFATDAHHGYINRGIDPSRIEAATHTRIRQVAVRELPHGAGRSGDFTLPDRLTRNGNSAVIYRPGRDISVARNPFLPGHDTQFAGRRGSPPATRGFTSANAIDNTRGFQTARPNVPRDSTPGATWNDAHGGEQMRHWSGAGNTEIARSVPAPDYRPGYSSASRSTPAWRQAPSWHSAAPSYTQRSAPSWSAPAYTRSAPSSGGTHAWGGGGNSGGGGMHFSGGGNPGGGNWGGGMNSGQGFHR